MIDTHAHLLSEYYDNMDEVIETFTDTLVISCGVDDKTNIETLSLVNKYKNIYGAIGIHPSEASVVNDASFLLLEENINNDYIVAIGEIGLDYHYPGDYELQKVIFIRQLELALKYNKPVIIHSREAYEDTYAILAKYPTLKKVIHSFGYDYQAALKSVEIGCMIGINGIVTFKKSDVLKEVVKSIDLKYILLETDAPYLTPIPFRGTKNDSSKLEYIAREISAIKGISLDSVVAATTYNANLQFDLKPKKW